MFITLYNQFAWLCRLYCHACLFKKHLFRIFFFFFTMNYVKFLCPWVTKGMNLLKNICLLGCWSLVNKSWSRYKPVSQSLQAQILPKEKASVFLCASWVPWSLIEQNKKMYIHSPWAIWEVKFSPVIIVQ